MNAFKGFYSLVLPSVLLSLSPVRAQASPGGNQGRLVGDNSGCTFNATKGDQVGTAQDPIDPLLGPLQNNGGPTLTQALLDGSPAIDTGTRTECPATDQRGYARPVDGDGDGIAECDIGTYEYGAAP